MTKTMAEDTDGGKEIFQRRPMRCRIDAECKTADDEQPGPGHLADQLSRYYPAIFTGIARADNGHDLMGIEIGVALVKKKRRNFGKIPQLAGIVPVRNE